MADMKQIYDLLQEVKAKIELDDLHGKQRAEKIDEHLNKMTEHQDAMAHEEMAEVKSHMEKIEKMKKDGTIHIKMLPEALHSTMKAFDTNDDEEIDMEELQRGAEMYKAAKNTAGVMMKVSAALMLLIFVLVGVLAAIMFTITEEAKEAHTGSTGMMTPAGETLGQKAVSTGAATEYAMMSSANSDSYFENLDVINLSGAGSKSLSLKVSGFYRQPCVQCSSGTVVSLITAMGVVDVVNTYTKFYPSAAMLEVDSTLTDFTAWRNGAGKTSTVEPPIGRADSENEGRRKLLRIYDEIDNKSTKQTKAEAAVLKAAGFEAMSTADVAAGSEGATPLVSVAELVANDYVLGKYKDGVAPFKNYGESPYDPYNAGMQIMVPDHMSFSVWHGMGNSMAFHLEPNENAGAFFFPDFHWTGGTSGTLVINTNGMAPLEADGKSFIGGNLDLHNGKGEHIDQTIATHSTKEGVQLAFMHVLDLDDISDQVGAIAAAHPDVVAQVFYEVIFNIPNRKGNDFSDITSSIRITLSVAKDGFAMEYNMLQADGDFNSAEATMKMFGESVTLPARRHLLAGASTFHDEFASKLSAMLTAVDGLDEVEALSLGDAETQMLETRYVNFARSVVDRGSDLSQITGTGSKDMQEYMMPDPSDNRHPVTVKFMYAIGIGSNKFGIAAETAFEPPAQRRSVIEAEAASKSSKSAKSKSSKKKAEKTKTKASKKKKKL